MSELQIALLIIGIGVIFAVYFYGWWQQRQYRRKFGSKFQARHDDALYHEHPARGEATDQQPELADMVEEAISEALPDEEPAEAAVAAKPVQPVAPAKAVPTVLDESCALLDARRDFIVELHLAEPAPPAVLDGLWQRKFDFGKPVQICGLTLGNRWERAIAESQTLYSRFRAALQLVDRGGVISAAKLAEFRDLLQGVARQLKANATIPNVNETHRHAVELDALCAEVDQMVGINLVPPGERMLAGSKIAQTAAVHGMKLEADGAFHQLNPQGHSLFSLSSQDNKPFQHHTLETLGTSGVTLLLDVPRVEHPAEQFDQMIAVAHEMAKELQVNLVDDNRVVLSDGGLARIREQIAAVEEKMCGYNLPPGSAQTRRLFS